MILYFGSFSQTASQTITIISPNGGENWQANSTQLIKWESKDVDNVEIEYSFNNGFSWRVITRSLDATTGEFLWNTPDLGSPYFLVRIRDKSKPNVYDVSNKNFTLTIKESNKRINKNAEVTTTTSDAIRIMPLGDSITEGYPDDNGYRRYLYKKLVDTTGYNVNFVGGITQGSPADFDRDHEGHGGWQAGGTNPPPPGYQVPFLSDHLSQYLIQQKPQIVLLHIGTNDISETGSFWIKTPSQIADTIRYLMDLIYNNNPNTKTILARIINRNTPYPAKEDETTLVNQLLQARADSLITLGRNITVVDMEPVLNYSTDMSDSLHPNTNGYWKMSNTWFTTLTNVLPVLQLKLYLQGPFTAGSDTMTTALRHGGTDFLPTSSPYSDPPFNAAC